MHLELTVDESKAPVADKSKAIENALKVVRNRIDEFGVSEPLVQRAGSDRIIVELPGIDDPQRAQDVVQKSAFLEFQITDKTQALEKSLPRIDAALKDTKVTVAAARRAKGDERHRQRWPAIALHHGHIEEADSTKKDSTAAMGYGRGPGAFSKLVQQGQMPGEYVARVMSPWLLSISACRRSQRAAAGKVLRWSSDTVSLGNRVYRPLTFSMPSPSSPVNISPTPSPIHRRPKATSWNSR
jgi:preprotein translocase subunit SecD